GHCIGVDPYYLAHKAESLGYQPDVILSGRRVNNNMGQFVANKVIKLMIGKGQKILNSNVLVLGITFKENCPDICNTKVIDIINELKQFGCKVDIHDPWADEKNVKKEYNLKLITQSSSLTPNKYHAIILAVSHNEFLELDYCNLTKGNNYVIYDIKSILPREMVDDRL
ncbi:MAG: Vi polysaccharide biosynthesis protein VipA/TviB, partial [Bacteroidetes bacterium HGW-Bacteroidetes-17]